MSEAEVTRDPERWHRVLSLGVGLVWFLILASRTGHPPAVFFLCVAGIWFPRDSHEKYAANGFPGILLRRSSRRWICWALFLMAGAYLTIEAFMNPPFHARS